MHLGHRHLLAGEAALVERPGGLHHQQAADLDPHGEVAQHQLDALPVGQPDPEAVPLGRVGPGDLDAALRQAEPAHAVGQPRRARGGSASASGRRPRCISTFSAGISRPSNSSSQWPPCSSGPMIGMRRRISPAGLVPVEQEGGQALARVVGGPRHQDEMRGLLGAGDVPFAAGDHVGVAAAARPGSGSSPGSEPPPGCGSVMAKAERTSPRTIGVEPARLLGRACRPSPAPSCCRRRARPR